MSIKNYIGAIVYRIIRVLNIKQFVLSRLLNEDEKNVLKLYTFDESKSYLQNIGWFDSVRLKNNIDKDGNAIPWITYGAYFYLESSKEKLKQLNMFEYGMGSSTIYFSKLTNQIVSVDNNKEWFEKTKKLGIDNATLLFKENEKEYASSINDQNQKFDIVLVDGIVRNACVKMAINCLTDQGVIILDNSNRADYQVSFELLKANNFKSISFKGLAVAYYWNSKTTIFYKENNCLGI